MKKKHQLLTSDFLERLKTLREAVFRLNKKGELEGLISGQAPEFDAHRSYEPGDDPRYIDWNIYARLEKLLLKMYVMEEEIQVGILVDSSLSMWEPSGLKIRMAARMAAAFSFLALSCSHDVVIGAFSDRLEAGAGPYRSLDRLPFCFDLLNALPRGRRTDLGRGAGQFMSRYPKCSFMVILSDFFQEADVLMELDRIRHRGADLHLVQVVDHSELRPELYGEYSISDLEGGEKLNVFFRPDLLGEFRRRIRNYIDGLESACLRRAVPYLIAPASDDFEKLLIAHLLSNAGDVSRGP